MIDYNDKVCVVWNSANKKHYIERGYVFSKLGDVLEVYIKDLPKFSKIKIPVICDYCGKYYYPTYSNYRQKKEGEKDSCVDCKSIKAKETNLILYGCESPMQRQEIKQKSKETCMTKYGVESYTQTEECQLKMKKTCMEKYGVENYSSTQEYKDKVSNTNNNKYGKKSYLHSDDYYEKTKKTCMNKYGVDHYSKTTEYKNTMKTKCLEEHGVENYSQVEESKEKSKKTCLERYGVEFALQSDDVRQKGRESYYYNGTCATSKPQLKLCEMLFNEYGNCELNYPCGRYSLDCMVEINDIKFDIEYDGCFWHKNQDRDNVRNEFVIQNGYKVLRIVCDKSDVPLISDIKKEIMSIIENNDDLRIINYTQ